MWLEEKEDNCKHFYSEKAFFFQELMYSMQRVTLICLALLPTGTENSILSCSATAYFPCSYMICDFMKA